MNATRNKFSVTRVQRIEKALDILIRMSLGACQSMLNGDKCICHTCEIRRVISILQRGA